MNKICRILMIGIILSVMMQTSLALENIENKDYICIDKTATEKMPPVPETFIDKEFTDKKLNIELCGLGRVPKAIENKELNNKIKGFPIKRYSDSETKYATCNLHGACYDWADSRQYVTNIGASAYLTQHDPSIDQYNGIHSVAEIGVSSSTDGNFPENYIEVGWRKAKGDVTRLFTFWWKNSVPQCFNALCSGWIQVSNKYYPGMALGIDNNGKDYTIQYGYGNWWIWYNDEWIGYYPGSLWNGQFTKGHSVLYYGEVASKIQSTTTDMGNGLWASNPSAAEIKYQTYLSETAGWITANTVKYESSHNLYTLEPWGYNNMRYGGPGMDGSSSIELLHPNGGESFITGYSNLITWKYDGGVGPDIKLELLKGGVLDKVIVSTYPIGDMGFGRYYWYIDLVQHLGNDYKIKITSSTNPFLYNDESDNNFIITSPAVITINSPNGGETWTRGTTRIISWTATGNIGVNVKIELLKNGIFNSLISSGTPNDGSFSWYIPTTQILGTDFKIKITSTSDSVTDSSNNNFAITSGTSSITVVSPNGGENWIRGNNKEIKWSSTGTPGTNIKIELYKGGMFNKLITSSTPNDGSYIWLITTTQTLGLDYKVKITSTTNSAYTDQSNNNFIISAGSITVTSPNGGENWQRGTTKTIKWTKTGSTGSYVKIELLKGGIVNKVINSYTLNDGSYSWTIPSTQKYGTDYKVRITSIANSIYKDTSNNNFKIY